MDLGVYFVGVGVFGVGWVGVVGLFFVRRAVYGVICVV